VFTRRADRKAQRPVAGHSQTADAM
jgi:hypothetical protein